MVVVVVGAAVVVVVGGAVVEVVEVEVAVVLDGVALDVEVVATVVEVVCSERAFVELSPLSVFAHEAIETPSVATSTNPRSDLRALGIEIS